MLNANIHVHDRLYLKMINTRPFTDPKQILKNIKNCLKLTWTLRIDNTLLPMTAELVHLLQQYHVALNDPSLEDGVQMMTPKYIYLYENLVTYAPLYITPLYYNELIELKHSEFELFRQNEVLLDKITNKSFLIGDFTTVQNKDGHNLARISLHSSGFLKDEQDGNKASTPVVKYLPVMLTCFILLTYI